MERLGNYLITYRKRRRFSQRDVATLVGSGGRSHVSNFERGQRLPSVETALALEIVLGTPVRELFAGLYARLQRKIARRAGVMTRRLDQTDPSRARRHKLNALKSLGCLRVVGDSEPEE